MRPNNNIKTLYIIIIRLWLILQINKLFISSRLTKKLKMKESPLLLTLAKIVAVETLQVEIIATVPLLTL
jgi:hypothetical protein